MPDFASSSRLMPKVSVALHWGSTSTTQTEYPARAKPAPRLTAAVLLPHPPFWLANTMISVRLSCIGEPFRKNLSTSIQSTSIPLYPHTFLRHYTLKRISFNNNLPSLPLYLHTVYLYTSIPPYFFDMSNHH